MSTVPAATQTWDGSSSASWATNANWVVARPAITNDAIVFNASSTGNRSNSNDRCTSILTLTLSGNPGGLITVNNNTSALTIANAGGITISAGASQDLTITGSQNLALGIAQSWTANDAGRTLTVSAAVNNGGFLLTILGSGNTAVGGIISGTGGLTKNGAGMLTLSGANSYTGTTTISAGTLKAQTVAFSTTPRTWSITSGAVLNIDGNTDVATGTATISGAGTLRFTGGTFAASGPGKSITMSLGSGGMIDVQSGANMRNGGWQDITWTSNLASLNADGTFDVWDGNAVTVDALTGSGTVDKGYAGSVTMTVGANNGSGTFNGVIMNTSGTLDLAKTGTGTQVLTGANTYTGTTTVSTGTLKTQGGAFWTTPRTWSISSGAVLNIDGNTGVASGTTTISGAGTLRFTGGIFANEAPNFPCGSGNNITLSLGSGSTIDVQSGTIMYNGGWQNITWTANLASMNVDGTFDAWDGNAVTVDALTGSGTVNKGFFFLVNENVTMTVGANNGSGTFSGVIQNTSGMGMLLLTKTGTGTQTLSGANTYTGATTVSGGTLLVTGSLAAGSAVGVGSSATLGGTGTIGGAITLNNGSTIAPGTGGTTIGTLTTANINSNATSTYSVDLDGTLPDQDSIYSSGTVALGAGSAALSVASIANSANGKVYRIIAAASVTGTFTGKAEGSTFVVSGRLLQISYVGNKVTLTDVSTGSTPAWSQVSLGTINGGSIGETKIFLGTTTPNALICRNLTDGSGAWSYTTGITNGCGTPTYTYISGSYVLVAASGSDVVGVNENGSTHFAATAIGGAAGTPYISPDNTSFFVTRPGFLSKRLLSNGSQVAGWDVAVTNLSTAADIVVYRDYVYVATTDGKVHMGDAADFTPLTTYEPATLTGVSINLPLMVSDRTLYITPNNNTLHAVSTSALTATKTLVTYSNGSANSGPAFCERDLTKDSVYTAADVYVYLIKDEAGGQKWAFTAAGTVNSGPLACNNTVYFGANGGYYYAINKATGVVRANWPYNAVSGNATSGPWIDFTNNHAIFASTGGNLDAFTLEP